MNTHWRQCWRVFFGIGVLTSVCAARAAAAIPDTKPAAATMAAVIAHSVATDWRPLDPEQTLYLQLDGGRVVMELAPRFAPQHVENIKTLVRAGYFDGLMILRVQDNYVVQWGDPESGDTAKARSLRPAQARVVPEFSIEYDKTFPFTRLPGTDGYAPVVGFSAGFAAGRDPAARQTWLAHCYGALGVGRDDASDSGNGAELYVVIGHAPRHLDRNIAVVGRVIQGIELLSSLPRGTAAMGFFAKPEQRVPLRSIRLGADLPLAERIELDILRTDTDTWKTWVESRRNRHEPWFKRAADFADLCNIPVPVRAHVEPIELLRPVGD